MKRIGRYEICGRLGRGGMSTVYKARAPITGRVVALKVLKPRDEIFEELVGWQKLKQLFLEEARIMGAISHDHIAKVIDADLDDETPFMVLEYFSHSIGDFIGEAYRVEQDTRPISIPRTCMYVDQALKGLERLHFTGIVHRDVKPYNMMITNDDRVKLIDFGLSRVRGEESLAIPGMQVGSPYYTAPEQMKDPENADARADLFSLGVLMYRMFTGRLVSAGPGDTLPARRFNPDLGDFWDGFLAKALAVNPDDRFRSAQEMRLALQTVVANWQQDSAGICRLYSPPEVTASPSATALRSQPARLMYKDIRQKLDLDRFFRPLHFHRHQLHIVSPHMLLDPLTGLYWQRQGSGFTLDWRQACDYVAHLNEQRAEGKSSWRLPTTEELLTILRPPTVERDICLDPSFAPTIHWLWSADHCTKKQAWMVDIVESYIGRQDIDGSASVCAVSG
ncbi:MAG: protein kinase [Desulfofustis sp.]|nr:protein kinase [Desulfofustis sp.]